MDDSLDLFAGPGFEGLNARKLGIRQLSTSGDIFGKAVDSFVRVPQVEDEDCDFLDFNDVAELSLFEHHELSATTGRSWDLARHEYGRLMLPRSRIEPVDARNELIPREHHRDTIYTRVDMFRDAMAEREDSSASFSWRAAPALAEGASAPMQRSPSPPPPAGAVLMNPWLLQFHSSVAAAYSPSVYSPAAKPAAFEAGSVGARVVSSAVGAAAAPPPSRGAASAVASAADGLWAARRMASEAPSTPGLATPEPMELVASPGTVATKHGVFPIEAAIYVWERTSGFAVHYPDGRREAMVEGMKHARCHYCVNGPRLSQTRSKWLVKCRRPDCTTWLCQAHYTPAMAVGLTGVPQEDAFEGLINFEHSPLLCLVDCGLCCCSERNHACLDTTQKTCATFGSTTHKCEKMRHRVYNRTKRRKRGDGSADHDGSDDEHEPEPAPRSRKRPAHAESDSDCDVQPVSKRRRSD